MNCPFCNRKYSTKKNLIYHIENKVCLKNIEGGYQCNSCKKYFKTMYNLKRHINRKIKCTPISTKNPPISTSTKNPQNYILCKYCSNTFSRKDSLKRHLKYRCKINQKKIIIRPKKNKSATERFIFLKI